jgi:hypothetical protein
MRKRNMPSPDRADAMMMTLVNVSVITDIKSHTGHTITRDLMGAEW